MLRHLTLLLLTCGVLTAAAQADEGANISDVAPIRPVMSAYMLEYGTAHIADTYLTPLHYRGESVGMQYQRSQAMRMGPQKWAMQLALGTTFDHTKNPAKNATMASIDFGASWRMWRKFAIIPRLAAGVGPGASLNVGAQYLARNGNNPASAKAAVAIDACAYASYALKVWRFPLTLRYQASLPLLGAFFMPNYGQLYYQIYLGDTQKLAHVAWPGCYFSLDNQVTADINLGSVSLRLGYHGSILSSKANNIVSNLYTHALTIGITTEWISLPPGKQLSRRLRDARIIRYDDI